MAVKYKIKKHRQHIIIHTVITALLLCVVFLSMVQYFYKSTAEDAYEQLHIQTKQIKDDMTLQLLSDRENLQTMANFAAELYMSGENYDGLLHSFKAIGLIANIGILNPDNTFVTKAGVIDLDGKISFDEEASRGTYISGRVKDLTIDHIEIMRNAVPIVVDGKTVGMLYGVIRVEDILGKYKQMADDLNAQLFVYEKETGNFVIDSVRDYLKNISELKTRKYTNDNTYENMVSSEKGNTSFISAYSGEELYVHYSLIEKLGWTIMLARPESLVFEKAHIISNVLILTFLIMAGIIVIYLLVLMRGERNKVKVTQNSSKIRKLLLEVNQQQNNIVDSLKEIAQFSKARSAVFFDANGEYHKYSSPARSENALEGEDKKYFVSEILRYAAELHGVNRMTFNLMCITQNNHLLKTNSKFYYFLKKHKIDEFTFATVVDRNNHVGILGVFNPHKRSLIRALLEEIAFCFSIAIYNKNHLNRTEIAATTDSLTGASNRVAYKKDLLVFDSMRTEKFSCLYIDVNELHLRNNKYGHAAGDEMLLYIANTLKEVFYGHKVYRMGGDEFLVFVEGVEPDAVKKSIDIFMDQLRLKDYHVAIGKSYRAQNTNTEEMVREAELRMYEAKAQYYQNKEQSSVAIDKDSGYVQIKTGISEIDRIISMLKDHYNGIYKVSLATDKAHRILMPKYLGYDEDEDHFSNLLNRYIDETVDPDFHRAVISFLNYDVIRQQISEGKTPRITYKKINGETVILSVYPLGDEGESSDNTLWVFAKN